MNPFQVPQRFNRLQIEITTACNLKCAGCQRTIGMADGTWANRTMKADRFAHLLHVCPPADVIILQGIGEPTLHPDLATLIGLARDSGKYRAISFNTNALVHDGAFYRHMRSQGLGHVSISVDSLDPDTIDKVRAGTDIDRLRDQIRDLMVSGLGITLSIVLSRHNLGELDALLTEFGTLGVGLIEVQPLIDYTAAQSVLDQAQIVQAQTIIAAARARFARTNIITAAGMTPNGRKCRRPFHAGYVTVDGYLTPCCTTDDIDQFGRTSLFETDFATAWNAPGTVAWFNTYLDDEPQICRGCSFNSAGARPPTPQQWRSQIDQRKQANDQAGAQTLLETLTRQEEYGRTLFDLGLSHFHQGRFDQAADMLTTAWRLAPSGAVGNALGLSWLNQGRADMAVPILAQAVTRFADFPLGYLSLSSAQDALGQGDHAAHTLLVLANRALAGNSLSFLDQAVTRLLTRDKAAPGLITLAHSLRVAGYQDRCLKIIAFLLQKDPDDVGLLLAQAVALLPVIYDDDTHMTQVRQQYAQAIATFAQAVQTAPPDQKIRASQQVGNAKPFLLGYQGENDRALQRLYGDGITGLMQAAYPAHATVPATPRPQPGEKIKVGFAAAQWSIHSVSKLFGGWIRTLDRSRFQVIGYNLNTAPLDEYGTDLSQAFDLFRTTPPGADATQAWADTIAQDRLHVLIYPELGMEAVAIRLACLRLAPRQGFAWGHPVASGLSSIDFFLSSDLMEPDDAQSHYDETLVRLPGLSIHYLPLPAGTTPLTRQQIGAQDGRPLFLCCQSLFKYRPQDDDVLARLAARVPQGQFVFLGDPKHPLSQRFVQRLGQALARHGLTAQGRIILTPQVPFSAFAALLHLADIYLDSLSWSGGNTSLEAATQGVPMVTLPGPMMRGRHTAAILRHMGLTELIADHADDYVDKAARLATDPVWRNQMAQRTKAAAASLFGNTAPVIALQDFLAQQADSLPPP